MRTNNYLTDGGAPAKLFVAFDPTTYTDSFAALAQKSLDTDFAGTTYMPHF